MLILTIHEAIVRPDLTVCKHYLYLYRDAEAVFYVGRSYDPLERLQQHLGLDTRAPLESSIGNLLIEHQPASLEWSLDLYTLADCLEWVAQYMPASLPFYRRELQRAVGHEGEEDEENYFRLAYTRIGDTAEQAMIQHFQPYLNVAHRARKSASMPLHYAKLAGVTHKGLKISE